MQYEILLSVIVTVYNIESYLGDCLDSIINQTYKKLEIILIDDGSCDKSGNICDEYALRDMRIKVLHKENEGLVAARKSGIVMATGELVAYVDGDDWLETDYYEKLMNLYKKNNADVVMSGCIKETVKKQVFLENNLSEGYYEKSSLIHFIYPQMLYFEGFYKFGIQQYLWNKLYKRELLEKYQLKVDDAISNGEDVACLFPLLLEAESIEVSNIFGYHYRIHTQSMTAKLNEDYPLAINRLYQYLKEAFNCTVYVNLMERQLLMYYTYMTTMLARYVLGVRMIPEFQYQYNFPFSKIRQGSNIFLLMGGKKGDDYLVQLQRTKLCNLVDYLTIKEFGNCFCQLENRIRRAKPDIVVVADENVSDGDWLVVELLKKAGDMGYFLIH